MNLLENLNWRYATKKMNGEKVPQEKLDYILEAARLAPSSSGIQPYRLIVVTDPEILEKIKVAANNQSQITDCSHLIVFAAWDAYGEESIGDVFAKTVAERGMPEGAMNDYKDRLWGMYKDKGTEWHHDHAAKQAYIALGLAMAAAAEQKVDATPMEGFIPEEVDEILGLKEKGLKSVALLPIGYRSEDDWLVKMKKFRTPKEEFVTTV